MRPRLLGWVGLQLDRSAEAMGGTEQALELRPGCVCERAPLTTEYALKEDGLTQQGDQVRSTPGIPRRLVQLVSSYRSLEVDQHDLQRRWANDDVLQLGVAVSEPGRVKRRQLAQRTCGKPPQPRG